MTRRQWLLFTPALAGCGKPEPAPDLFTETVAGVWHRTSLRALPASQAPDPVPRTAIRQAQVATYEGPGKLEARLYQLTSPAVGLDLVQRWRPSADTVFFQAGNSFVVVKWQDADRKALQEFVRSLQHRLNADRKRGEP